MYSSTSPSGLFFWVLLLIYLKMAFASLYPTQPIANTEYSAGQIALVTWKDDRYLPHLKDMGIMKIDLHNANFVSSLDFVIQAMAWVATHNYFGCLSSVLR